jgi:DNA polymerase-3 subunit epsilon
VTVWHDGRLTAFDLETTAPDPEEARIVSFAISTVGGGLASENLSAIVDPGVEIPEEAAAIHGITTERARAEGSPPVEALRAIISAIASTAILSAHPLVIFNARYDLTVLDRECRRHGVEPLDTDRIRVVDPFVLDKWLDRYRKGSRKLDAMAEHYADLFERATGKKPRDVLAGDGHDAGNDAAAAARLAWLIARYGKVMLRYPQHEVIAQRTEWKRVRDDIDALHAAQQRWAVAEQIRLRGYFESVGQHEDAASVREAWPIIPFEEPEPSGLRGYLTGANDGPGGES